MQYFKHSSSMHEDPAIKRLMKTHGLEGYGLYNYILELITLRVTNDSPIPTLPETPEELSLTVPLPEEKIAEILADLTKWHLLSYNEVTLRYECTKLYKYFQTSQTKSPAIRCLITQYARSRADETVKSWKVMPSHGCSMESLGRLEENIVGKGLLEESSRLNSSKKKRTTKKSRDTGEVEWGEE